MFTCPHCHKPIDIGIADAGHVPWYKFDPANPKVSLGCGTLILIAIIVALCSGGVSDKEFKALQRDIERLEKKIDSLAANPPAAPPAAAQPAAEQR